MTGAPAGSRLESALPVATRPPPLLTRRENGGGKRLQYSTAFLLGLRSLPECSEMPEVLHRFPTLTGTSSTKGVWADTRISRADARGRGARGEEEYPARRPVVPGRRAPPGMNGKHYGALDGHEGDASGKRTPAGRWDQEWGPRNNVTGAQWAGPDRWDSNPGRGRGRPNDRFDHREDGGNADWLEEEAARQDARGDGGAGFFGLGRSDVMDEIERERQQHHRSWMAAKEVRAAVRGPMPGATCVRRERWPQRRPPSATIHAGRRHAGQRPY